MAFEDYVLLVALLAVIYSAIVRVIQLKFTDREAMKSLQTESKELNDQLKKAQERKDQFAADALMKKQMDLFPKMNKIMMAQLKVMFGIIIIFFGFNWTVTHLDPTVQDDITLELLDDGNACDLAANDGTFSACFNLSGQSKGLWLLNAMRYDDGAVTGQNFTAFSNGNAPMPEDYVPKSFGKDISLKVEGPDAENKISLYATSKDASQVEVSLDSATSFFVYLPAAIPVLNVRAIYEPYWWFILIAMISGVAISLLFNAYTRLQSKKGESPKASNALQPGDDKGDVK